MKDTRLKEITPDVLKRYYSRRVLDYVRNPKMGKISLFMFDETKYVQLSNGVIWECLGISFVEVEGSGYSRYKEKEEKIIIADLFCVGGKRRAVVVKEVFWEGACVDLG